MVNVITDLTMKGMKGTKKIQICLSKGIRAAKGVYFAASRAGIFSFQRAGFFD